MECNGNTSSNGFHTNEKSGKLYTINRQSVIAARMIGKGRQGLLKFSSIMGLSNPVSRPAYSEHTKFINEKSELLKDSSLSAAGKTAKHIIAKSSDLPESETLNVPTSFDGSWGSRGWTARDGVATAIADVTGQVVDAVYKSSSCRDCFVKKQQKDSGEISFIKYVDWYMQHEPQCLLNHDGSSSKMEADGILAMFERSVKLHNVRYRPYIGDGDSSSFSNVEKNIPYGPLLLVVKSECVNHVTKRMGTALRSLQKEYKGKKLDDGKPLNGKGGGLTIAKIDTIQSFNGLCIRRNKGDAEKMSKQVWAILNHYSSTPENPNHVDCPLGRHSWCSYNRDLATGESTHRPIKNPLRPAVREVMIPIFNKLSRQSFLH